MLWKKESQRPDALYVNIFDDERDLDNSLNLFLFTLAKEPSPEKSDVLALEKRNEGNAKFRVRSYIEAMELYSDSLRFAKPDSEHISLAYANRAACFLCLKMYANCLKDIDLAIEAGYPGRLMPKLVERKDKCVKEMQDDQQAFRKMAIEPDDQFPLMSNVAQIQKNKKGGYSVVAKADIDVGQTIVAQDGYMAYLSDHYGSFCNICVKEYVNLVSCKKCTTAMFCPDCHGHFLHEYECGLNLCGEKQLNSLVLRLVRGTLLALKIFPNVDELVTFVEGILANPEDLPTHLLDDRSKFQIYISTRFESGYRFTVDEMVSEVYPAYKLLWSIPHVKEMFKLEKHRRFLMHLIGHQIMAPRCTSGFFGSAPSDSDEPTVQISIVMEKYFKHSCSPNLVNVIRDGQNIWFSVKPIKKGEQLYVSDVPLEMNTQERQEWLCKRMQTKCACPRCKGKTPSSAQQQQLVNDPAYRHFQWTKNNYSWDQMNIEQLKSLMDSCLAVLRNYGHLHWCNEIAEVIQWYRLLHFIYSTGGSNFNHPWVHALKKNSKM